MSTGFFSSTLFKRIASALAIAPLFIAVILYGDWPLVLVLGLAFLISVYEWYHLAIKTPLLIPAMIVGIMYMLISFSCFFALREVFSLNVVLLFIGMIWASDIGGYVTGKMVGGPKLIQKISPNKTWSGFIGAMVFPAVFAMLWISIFKFHPEFNDNHWLILKFIGLTLGAVMGCVGQAGDLLISFVKRQAQVKDTGALIPGHGGILDRIDSMLLAAPVFLVVLTLMSYVF